MLRVHYFEKEKYMSQNKTKKEHYVPRAYLQSFSDNGQCQLYDKSTNKISCVNIKNILTKRYLYDFDKELLKEFENIDEQAIEKILGSTVDNFWNNIVKNITENYEWFSPLKYSYHYLSVYKCVAIQLIRTPKGKQQLLEIYNEIYIKNIDKKLENVVLAKEIINILNDELKSSLLEVLLNEYGHICVGINNTDVPFISADNAIIVIPNIWDEHKKEYMIYYPITPCRCLLFHRRKKVERQLESVLKDFYEGKLQIINAYDNLQEVNRREKEMMSIINPITRELTQQDVLALNTCLYKGALRYIVYNPKTVRKKLWIDTF